jgi:hypothetical protein
LLLRLLVLLLLEWRDGREDVKGCVDVDDDLSLLGTNGFSVGFLTTQKYTFFLCQNQGAMIIVVVVLFLLLFSKQLPKLLRLANDSTNSVTMNVVLLPNVL